MNSRTSKHSRYLELLHAYCVRESGEETVSSAAENFHQAFSQEVEHLIFNGCAPQLAVLHALKKISGVFKAPSAEKITRVESRYPNLTREQIIMALAIQDCYQTIRLKCKSSAEAISKITEKISSTTMVANELELQAQWTAMFNVEDVIKKRPKAQKKIIKKKKVASKVSLNVSLKKSRKKSSSESSAGTTSGLSESAVLTRRTRRRPQSGNDSSTVSKRAKITK